jgi:hypothetical protein
MSDFVGIDVQGLTEVQNKLNRAIPSVQDSIVEQVAGYVVKVMQEQPTPNHSITRAQAYPEVNGWFSEKQRKWFFWALRTGKIHVPYTRTQEMRKAWKVYGKGKNAIVANETQAAVFTMDDERQARFSKLVGWETVGTKLKARSAQITRQAEIGAKNGLRKAGIK